MASNVATMRSHNTSALVTGVDHSISRIYRQKWISRNVFTFRPVLIGMFLLNWGWGIPRKSWWHRFWDTRYIHTLILDLTLTWQFLRDACERCM